MCECQQNFNGDLFQCNQASMSLHNMYLDNILLNATGAAVHYTTPARPPNTNPITGNSYLSNLRIANTGGTVVAKIATNGVMTSDFALANGTPYSMDNTTFAVV